jgi:outer membrane lipoprotein SlyB
MMHPCSPPRPGQAPAPIRPRRVFAGLVATLVALLVLSRCAAPPRPVAAAHPPAPPAAIAYGVIAAIRPLPLPGAVSARILAAVGALPTGLAPAPVRRCEFIIAEDDGRAVSVIQAADPALHPGERIALHLGARTRIVRLSASRRLRPAGE